MPANPQHQARGLLPARCRVRSRVLPEIVAGAASWQHGQDPQLLRPRFYALKFSAAHLRKAGGSEQQSESEQHKSPG